MKRQRSIKGLFIYLFVGIVALFFYYLLTLSMLTTDPSKLEEIIELSGISGSTELLAFLAVISNIVPLIIGLVIGFFVADKVGLTSVIVHPKARENAKSEWMKGIKLAIILGLIAGVVISGLDYLFQPFMPESFIENAQPYEPYRALYFISALLYGGVVEELIIRFGVMSLLVLIFWKIFDRKSEKPSNWIFILSIIISAFLFAIGHIQATALATDMTSFVWFRMIVLNGLPGFIYGWLYWQHNLESAIVAHMFTHVGMNTLLLIVSLFL